MRQPGLSGVNTEASAGKKRIQHAVAAADAGKDQVLVEGSFEHARVGDAQNRVGLLDVVGDAQAGFGFPVGAEAVIEVAAQAEIERPVPFGDRVLPYRASSLTSVWPLKGKQPPPRVRS